MLSTAARPTTRLSIGVENSRRLFASRSREETTILGWSLGVRGWVVVGRHWPLPLVGAECFLLVARSRRSRAWPRGPGRSRRRNSGRAPGRWGSGAAWFGAGGSATDLALSPARG